jgi:hypothetical protein
MKTLVRAWMHVMRQTTPAISMGDIQIVVAIGALTYGIALVSVPAAWITIGTLLLVGWLAPRLPRRAKRGD